MCFDRLIMLHTHITELQLGSLRSRLPFFAVIARDGQVTVSASMYTEVNPTRPNATSRASRHLLGFLVNSETRHLFGVRLVYIDIVNFISTGRPVKPMTKWA